MWLVILEGISVVFVLAVLSCIWKWLDRHVHRRGHGISLLVPFRSNHPGDDRELNFLWLKEYWANELPYAEFIQGYNDETPFCKTAAVNDAASRATGDILVIIDADAYLTGDQLLEAAHRIREARREDRPLWLVPYRRLYRLNRRATEALRDSDPADPLRFSTPPPHYALEHDDTYGGNRPDRGHWFAAMCMVVPVEAFRMLNGMDTRFKGWGGEDVAFMLALDTLYAQHKSVRGEILHMHHPRISEGKFIRKWAGQDTALLSSRLNYYYRAAYGDPLKMLTLLNLSYKLYW